MVVLFFISALFLLFSSFGLGFSYSFKETYKEYYKLLFVRKGYKRPYNWPYSRQKNHKEWVGFIILTVVFFTTTVICGVLAKMWIPLLILLLLAAPLLVKIGTNVGENECHRTLKESCESFKLYLEWEKEKKSPSPLGDFSFKMNNISIL